MLYESEYYGVQSLPLEQYLMHHGIKGQKWGVRRFQNLDGSLTPAGKERYLTGNGTKSVIDENTGFKLKTREWTPEEDMKVINPGFKTFDSGYRNNCMSCTTAYELRRRGFDVTAVSAPDGFDDSDIAKWFPKARVRAINKTNYILTEMSYEEKIDKSKYDKDMVREYTKRKFYADIGMNSKIAKDTISTLVKQGDGARGNLLLAWGGCDGHSVIYEVKGKKLIIRDAQCNKTYTNPEKILKTAVAVEYARLDNLEFDKDKIKEAVR